MKFAASPMDLRAFFISTRSKCVSIRSGLGIAFAATAILGMGFSAPAAAQGAGCTGGGKISKTIAKLWLLKVAPGPSAG